MRLHKIFDFHNVTRHDTKYKNFLIEKFPKSKHVISTGKLYCDQESIYCPNIPTFITILTWVQGNKLIVLKNMNNRRSTLYLIPTIKAELFQIHYFSYSLCGNLNIIFRWAMKFLIRGYKIS